MKLSVAVITGSAGLIGSEAVRYFAAKGMQIVGIDNDMRSYFFGADASTEWMRKQLVASTKNYEHHSLDIRNQDEILQLFQRLGDNISLVIHTAAQPSHDWAANEPFTGFNLNAGGTLTMLEATRRFCPRAAFIFTSPNKVYVKSPNFLPLVEQELRWKRAK